MQRVARISWSQLGRRGHHDVRATMLARPAKVMQDFLTPTRSQLLTTLLSDMMPGPLQYQTEGDGRLPDGHMLVYFPLATATSQLAADGADADHVPPCDGASSLRRLWAGGSVEFPTRERLALDGRAWTCTERIEDVKVRDGRYFVQLSREYSVDDCAEILETRRLAFIPRGSRGENDDQGRRGKGSPTHSAPFVATAAHLFHFSALTYNAHRIHFDEGYARADGHAGLLVHGPLCLALMLRGLKDAGGEGMGRFTYRNYAPLYAGERGVVNVRGGDVWIENARGEMVAGGRAEE